MFSQNPFVYKINTRFFIIIFCFIFTACKSEKMPEICLKKALTSDISDLFDKIHIIPLETHPDGLIGTSILKLIVEDNKIIILNQSFSRNNLLCFDELGNFVFTIDRIGNGPGEYKYLDDILVNMEKQQLILNNATGKFSYYDLNGNFLFTQFLAEKYTGRYMLNMGDSVYLVFNQQSGNPNGYDLLHVDAQNLNIIQKSCSRNHLSGITYPNKPVSIYKHHLLYYDATDTIFDITDIMNRKPLYAVDFGKEHHISNTFIMQRYDFSTINEATQKAYDFTKQKKMKHVNAIFENAKFIVIGYAQNHPDAEVNEYIPQMCLLFYDKSTQKVYDTRRLSFSLLGLPNIEYIGIMGQSGEAFYTVYTPNWSKEDKKKLLQSPHLPEKIKNAVMEYNEESNPWLIILE